MRKTYFFIYFLFLFHFVFAQQKESPFKIDLIDNSISIVYQGKERLNKGIVDFQGTSFSVKNASIKTKAKENEIEFISNNKRKVLISVENDQNVLTFSLSPNKNNSADGHHYSGLFFDIPGFRIGTSIWRYGESKAWTKPKLVKVLGDLDTLNIQFFYWQYSDGLYGVAIPLGGKGFSASLGKLDGKIGSKSMTLVRDFYTSNIPILAVGFGQDIYKLAEEVIEAGMNKMGYPENLRKKKKFPEVFKSFGWCTWDAFGHNLSEEKIIAGVQSFANNNFPIPFVLIDDGWLKVGNDSKLKSLYPDSAKFPRGFKPLIQKLKNDYGVQNVGIWHTINAYWKGIDETSSLGKQYKGILFAYQGKLPWSKDTLKTFYTPTPTSEKGMKFFDDWYSYLSNEGISFIKVDNQLSVGQISDSGWPLWNTGRQMQDNFQIPARKFFDGAVINCMEMTVDNVYHFRSSSVARVSDDYMPKETSYNLEEGNAAVHVTNCLYNSLWLSPIVWPDYDMFESYQLYPEYHAIARAISGGPIYVSDWPGEQNYEVLQPLILKNGEILRTDQPAQLTEDCLFQIQETRPLKAFSFVGETGLLGVWNTSNSGFVSGSFRPSDVHGIKGEKFIVFEFFSNKISALGKNDSIPLGLSRMDYRLFTVMPVKEEAAVIGLMNKYNSAKTVLNKTISKEQIEVTVAEAGRLGIVLSTAPKRIEVNGKQLDSDAFSFNQQLLKVEIPSNYSGSISVKIIR